MAMTEARQRWRRFGRRGARPPTASNRVALTYAVDARSDGPGSSMVRDALSSARFDPWRYVAESIDARMHRPPRSLRFYLGSAAVYAFLSYLAVQLVYDWELDRAGLHATGFHPQAVFRNTYAVHFVSFAVWLVIALITGALVHRVQSTLATALDEAQRRTDELTLISEAGAAISGPLPPTRL